MTQMPPEVLAVLAEPGLRLSHYLWHTVRDRWLSLSKTDRARFAIEHSEWVPRCPSLDQSEEPILGKDAGRDFLFMHRHMIHTVDCLLVSRGHPRTSGWLAPPAVNDPAFPKLEDSKLPPDREYYGGKDDEVWSRLLLETGELLSHKSLRSLSLSDLGSHIEYGIHAAMHQRFGGYGTSGELRSVGGELSKIDTDPRWNVPAYDSLLDPYSAHVNPLFWKIHGWIDHCITLWEVANQKRDDGKDAWIGGMHMAHCHEGTSALMFDTLFAAAQRLPDDGSQGFFRIRKVGR